MIVPDDEDAEGAHMGSRGRVLVIDDDTEIRAMLRRRLTADGFDVDSARDGSEGLALARQRKPDVVVLDIAMPGIDGVETVRLLREAGAWTPVLMLTAHGEIDRRLDSFRAGADDFLAKPFHHEELLLRIDALIRRAHGVNDDGDRIRKGDVILDRSQLRCWRGERELQLAPREFALLEYLMDNAGVVLHRDQINSRVWHDEISEGSNAVDVYVGYLRRKLEADDEPRVIHTVRGQGFVFQPDRVLA